MELKQMYCPFPGDANLIAACERVIKAHNSKHILDQFKKDVLTPGDKVLKNMSMFQQLYIVAHGAPGSGSVYSDSNVALSMADLAKQLKEQGLTSRIRKVKLYACQGGSNGQNATANQLKAAMLTQGFTSVSTYGYTMDLAQGALTDDGGKVAYPYADRDDDPVSAKSVRVKF
ncbi:MAG: hypothetical protein RI907_2314 [Pseudomonadota bacterium]|jgi:hypothetical protein